MPRNRFRREHQIQMLGFLTMSGRATFQDSLFSSALAEVDVSRTRDSREQRKDSLKGKLERDSNLLLQTDLELSFKVGKADKGTVEERRVAQAP